MVSRLLSMATAAAIIAFASVSAISSAGAADTGVSRSSRHASNLYCQHIWRCGPSGCDWHRVCTRACPDGSYTCTPLYGAYGPYGGVSFWGGYTDAGWAYP